jgi:hypothetical protein
MQKPDFHYPICMWKDALRMPSVSIAYNVVTSRR